MTAAIREKLEVKTPEEAIPWLNLLIYGDPGAGKTYLAATAQDHKNTSPILFLDVEGGTTTIRHRPDVDVIQIRTMQEIEKIHKELFLDKDRYYKTVIIDSITELQKLDMNTVMREQWQKKPDSTDIYVPSQREWGKSGERMRMIIRGFRDLPCNTIVTALLGESTDDSTGIKSYYPSLPGKLRNEVPGFFDVVGYLNTATEKDGDNKEVIIRQLQLAKTKRVIAKDRTSSLGDLIKNPTIPMMWELIHSPNTNGTKGAK